MCMLCLTRMLTCYWQPASDDRKPNCIPALQNARVTCLVRLMLSWLSAGLLEKLKGLAAVVERKLGDSVTVPVYGTHVASLKAVKETVKERTLHAGVLRSKQCRMELSPIGSA